MQKELVYEQSFDLNDEQWQHESQNWVMEGKGVSDCGHGFLRLKSTMFTVPRNADGHFNLWLKEDFPADVSIEWEFRYTEPGPRGLAIIIWAAKGRSGEDIFDPALPERRGEVMSDFHSGALNCYHTSYIARGRKTANLRKNYGFHQIDSGPDLSALGKADEWHLINVEQFGGRIKLFINHQIIYDFLDDGQVGGPPIETGGKLAFRQQNNLHEGHYKNLKVYALS